MNVREAISEASQQFGICLKEKQFDAIYEFCSGSDVFVSLPTGFGKSIIYAILPLVFDRIRGKYELITYYISFSTITLCINTLHRKKWKHNGLHQSLDCDYGRAKGKVFGSRNNQ